MKYNIRGNKIKKTKAIEDYIVDKLSKMDKFFENPDEITAKVIFDVRGKTQKVEVTIPYKSLNLRAEDTGEDVYSALDTAVDKLQRQFRKYKTKLVDKKRYEEIDMLVENYEDEKENKIIKRKSVFLKPMSEDEAVMQMYLLDHSFFIFKDEEDSKTKVVYKRKDGNAGIIETE